MTELTRTILDKDEVAKLERYLKDKPKAIILTHANPDGDAIGSAMGMWHGLKDGGYDIDVACIDGCPEAFNYINLNQKYWVMKW